MSFDRPLVMGILNVTPDSFSDGGRFIDPEAAVEHGKRLIDEGADLIDIGGESTRPGSDPVPLEEELRRVMPVIERLAPLGVPLSIDTQKPEVARAALGAGAGIINDVGGLRLPEMREAAAEAGCPVCIMHCQGVPKTMQQNPTYTDVAAEVRDWLRAAAQTAENDGIEPHKIWLDPGFGFGKTKEHNWQLLAGLHRITELGYPVLVGLSRKSFLGRTADDRAVETTAVQTLAALAGARILRAHKAADARRVAEVIRQLSAGISP